ncbi:MAG TPA: hypothetical protein DEP65_06425, partial [Ruminococcus sp.]|nr:hypothetical protein [Ruminococcus sp.]
AEGETVSMGGQTYESLDLALEAIPDNGSAEITLGAGEYTLSSTFIIDGSKNITIIGAGKSITTLKIPGGSAFKIQGVGAGLKLKDLSLSIGEYKPINLLNADNVSFSAENVDVYADTTTILVYAKGVGAENSYRNGLNVSLKNVNFSNDSSPAAIYTEAYTGINLSVVGCDLSTPNVGRTIYLWSSSGTVSVSNSTIKGFTPLNIYYGSIDMTVENSEIIANDVLSGSSNDTVVVQTVGNASDVDEMAYDHNNSINFKKCTLSAYTEEPYAGIASCSYGAKGDTIQFNECEFKTSGTVTVGDTNEPLIPLYSSSDASNTLILNGVTYNDTTLTEKIYMDMSKVSDELGENPYTTYLNLIPEAKIVKADKTVGYGSLSDAVAAAQNGETVTVLRDCIIDKPIEIKKSISIVGEGETAPTIKTTTADRVFNVTEASENLSISIKNIKAIEDSNNGYTRGISFYKNTGKIEFNIDKCEISSTYYALNVASENSNVVINVDNSKINGWAVAQTWSNNTSITINNSECISLNDKTYNADGSNDFSAFVFNVGVDNSYITLNNTEVKCQIEADENGNKNNQSIVSFRENQLENKLSINGGKCSGYSFFGVSYENTGYDVNISGTTFSYNGKEYVANGCFLQEYEGVDDGTTYTYYIIVPAEAKVIDTAKTTGATVTLDNLNKNTAVDPAADATYKVVVETAPAADAKKANDAIKANADTNTSKAMFDISVVKVDSNGTETVLNNVTDQKVTLTLGETPATGTMVYVYHVKTDGTVEQVAAVPADGTNKVTFTAPSFSTYAATYTATPIAEANITKNVGVAFERVGDTSEYNIILKALDSKTINRFMSADLTFDMNVTSGAVGYTVNPAASVNLIDKGDGRYEFNLDGLTSSGATGTEVTIGTVTFEGNGTVKFGVKTEGVTTNIVNTAKAANNIVDNYTTAGNGVDTGRLELNNAAANGVINATFTAPTKDLTVNVKFNNAITDNKKAYQDMKAVISGGDLPGDITVNFGTDEKALVGDTYTFTQALTQNVAYTVTVEGAGYRTARHTVTMTADKTLNFWNNVLDANNKQVIEVGARDEDKVTKNFLAGDIVKDNNINIYDLSAVVSYFGENNLVTAHPEYVRYDLNRDGKIDSKDVAYVLVSWGE